jgi:hypothetical protein
MLLRAALSQKRFRVCLRNESTSPGLVLGSFPCDSQAETVQCDTLSISLTRLGEAGADAFTIMKLAGHSSVTVSQRYVNPTPESCELALERLEALNAREFARAEGKKSLQKCLQPIAESA